MTEFQQRPRRVCQPPVQYKGFRAHKGAYKPLPSSTSWQSAPPTSHQAPPHGQRPARGRVVTPSMEQLREAFHRHLPHSTVKQNKFAFPLVGFWYFPSTCLCSKDLPAFRFSCELFSSQTVIPINPRFQAHPSPAAPRLLQSTSAKLSPAFSHKSHIWCQKYSQA